jgi:hypothetical protein
MFGSGYIVVLNKDTEAVPPFGVMQVIDVNEAKVAEVSRPTVGDRPDRILINGIGTIPVDGIGQGHSVFPTIVAYQTQHDDEESTEPAVGEFLGPKADSWYLHRGARGFVVLGGAGNNLVNVKFENKPTPKYGYEPVRLFTNTLAAYTRTDSVIEANSNGAIANIDSTAAVVGDRILYNQSSAHADNGIYEFLSIGSASTKFRLRRTWDADDDDDFELGYKVVVTAGTDHSGEAWRLTTTGAVNSGTQHFTLEATGDTPVTLSHRGKLDGDLTYQGSATMSIWAWNGSAEADTGVNVTVYDWLLSTGQSILSGTQITVLWDDASDRYYVVGSQCE